jgi:hypothetical protein
MKKRKKEVVQKLRGDACFVCKKQFNSKNPGVYCFCFLKAGLNEDTPDNIAAEHALCIHEHCWKKLEPNWVTFLALIFLESSE